MRWALGLCALAFLAGAYAGQDWWKPYAPPQTERENVFEFTQKPAVARVGEDRYEIRFAVKAFCDVTVAIVDEKGVVVRHLASGVLGGNAPEPFQKNSLSQVICWNGKDDLDWYHEHPETLKVRVMLGLKPVFDKLLGPDHRKALSGYVWGIAADPDGVYVFLYSSSHISWRKYGHDAGYVKELYPPSGTLPPEKLGGMGYIEYEPGRRAIQAPDIASGMWHYADWLPEGIKGSARSRPAVAAGRIYLLSSGYGQAANVLHYFNTDGSTDYAGLAGRPWAKVGDRTVAPHLAAAPDGKRLYFTNLHGGGSFGTASASPVLMSGATDGEGWAEVIVGRFGKPGSGDDSLHNPRDVATDSEGRVYVADHLNGRVQIFAPDGGFLKTLKVERPGLVQVHQKTGAVYVAHASRVKGQSVARITRFAPFPGLEEERHWDHIAAQIMTLDSWSPKPRLWISGRTGGAVARRFAGDDGMSATVTTTEGAWLLVYEDAGDTLEPVADFEKEARQEAGSNYMPFAGGLKYPVVCDPVRERAYYNNTWIFDLQSGKLLGRAALDGRMGNRSGLAFDKRGYLHVHRQGPGQKFLVRMDPERVVKTGPHDKDRHVEVPYDYGIEAAGYRGVLPMPTTDDKYYSWGMGVSMRGAIAVLNMYEVTPRLGVEGAASREEFVRRLQEAERNGAQEYVEYIRPRPDIDLIGGVIWTFAASGELSSKEAVIVGDYRSYGAGLDEGGFLYFVNGRARYVGEKPFLAGRGGNFGGEPILSGNRTPFTGTYIKAAAGAKFVLRNPVMAGQGPPNRPPDLNRFDNRGGYRGAENDVWAQGVEWMYAGASPIVSYHCGCMDMRACLDWYKRSFVPEQYRHSIGVLDANGNLICHAGRYGNLDEGGDPGPDTDGIAMTRGAYVSATDNYICIADWGRRLIVAKLKYEREEMAVIHSR